MIYLKHTVPCVLVLLTGVLWVASLQQSLPIPTTQPGAIQALNYMQEWAKWMAGIQTAALAVLVYVVFEKDSMNIRRLAPITMSCAFTAFVFLGAALFCSAWVLSSLPSQAVRVYSIADKSMNPLFDVYERPLYAWSRAISLGYLLALVHWLWGIGLFSLGATIGTLLFMRKCATGKIGDRINRHHG